jgi:tripartite motif-containing protein 2/3
MQGTAIKVLTPEGEQFLAFGGQGTGFNNFSLPAGIITDRRGYLWVVDTLRHIVPIFDVNGKFLDYIGAFGAGPGYFAFPSAIAASDDGKIVVLERVNRRLQCFELAQPSGAEMAVSVEETTSGEMVEE